MAAPVDPFLYTTTPQREYPAGSGVVVTTPGGSFANSAWVEVIASTSEAWFVTGLSVISSSAGLGMTEFDLAVWDGVAFVSVGTFQGNFGSNAVLPLTIPGDWIPSAARVGVRCRCAASFAGFTFTCVVLYYPGTPAGRVLSSAAPTELSVPSGGTSIFSSATPWIQGAWVAISAATLSEWAVESVQITPVAVVGSVACQMEIDLGIGPSPSQTVATVVRWSSRMLNPKAPTIATIWPMLRIPASTAVWARLRTSDSQIVNVHVQLVKLPSSTGLTSVLTNQPTAWYPPAANSTQVVTPASTWVNSSWVEVKDATAFDIAITALAVDACPTSAETEFDIGAGAIEDGSQAVIGTFRLGADNILANGCEHTILTLAEAQMVDAGTRLWLRARSASSSSRTLSAAVGYIASPSFDQMADNPQHSYIPAANGASLATSSTPWTNSAWGVLSASTAADLLLTGVALTNPSSAVVSVEIGIGTVGNETVLTLVRCCTNTLTNLWFALPVPHYVPIGTRLTIRYRKADTSTAARLLGVTYLGIPAVPAPPAPPTTEHFAIRRLRRAPHLSAEQVRVVYRRFQLDFEAGGPRDDNTTPIRFALRTSKDGGHTWGTFKWIECGKIGEYVSRAVWRNNGMSRDMVFEVINSDAAKIVLLQAFVDADPAVS